MIEVLQILVLLLVALALGWTATPSARGWACAALLVIVATVAFSALGLLMAGLLRAEATLAAANLVYLLFLVSGGVVVPLDRLPEAVRPVLEALPLAALTDGLRVALEQERSPRRACHPGHLGRRSWARLPAGRSASPDCCV